MTDSTTGNGSATASDLDTLEEDLPTTPEDVEALRVARRGTNLSPAGIAEALARLGTLSADELRSRPGPRGEPFELPGDDS